jgi:hypothetical protein
MGMTIHGKFFSGTRAEVMQDFLVWANATQPVVDVIKLELAIIGFLEHTAVIPPGSSSDKATTRQPLAEPFRLIEEGD